MKDSGSWAQSSRCCGQLKVVDEMKDFGSLTEGSKFFEHSGLLMTQVILGLVLNALDAY